ncbi:hypothetical protein OS493_005979 [Desmophyllum pertusum]|uniref:Uncharacterized protein n=1 Tax=Desmophyllum pertusum TaxID=174260 RepID=A0A9X0CGQ1_9CNID|nr:hypothetical protein OS493_005979 [Desmophyllum pertusum]
MDNSSGFLVFPSCCAGSVDVIKDAPVYQEKVTHLNEFSSNLVSDPCLGEEERRVVREETAICNENWNDLVNLANARQARMEENLNKLEQNNNKMHLTKSSKRLQRERRDKLHDWEERQHNFDSSLRKAERETERIEPIGDDLETVRRQYEDFQTNGIQCVNVSVGEESFLLIPFSKTTGLLVGQQKRVLQDKLSILEKSEGEIDRWNDQLVTLQDEIVKVENVCEQEIAPDFDTLEKQRKEVQNLKENVDILDPQVDEFLKSSDSLLDENDLPNKDEWRVEREAELLKKRWDKVKNDANSRGPRIEEEYLNLQKRQKDLLGEWKNSCNSTLKWITDTSARVQAQDTTAPDLDHARAQRQEIEQTRKHQSLGDGKDFYQIQRPPRNKLDKRIEQLEKEQRDKMKKWTDKTEPLDKWLVKNETAVESNEPIGYDNNYVKGQSEDATGNDHRPSSGAAEVRLR